MKVLILIDTGGASIWYKQGIANVLKYIGCEVRFVHSTQKLFDDFYEFEPDLFYSNTYSLDATTFKVLQKYNKTNVILRANDWGQHLQEIDPKIYPVGIASEQEKMGVRNLKEIIGDRLKYLFIHYHQDFIKRTMGLWESGLGVKVLGLNNAADLFLYYNPTPLDTSKFNPLLKNQCSILGGYWGYKSETLKPWIFPLCHPNSGLKVRIYGNSKWPIINYVGTIDDQLSKDLFAQTSINLNVHEPHSQVFGYDVNERIFKVLAAGGFLVSDYVEGIETAFHLEESIPMAKTPEEFKNIILNYSGEAKQRRAKMLIGWEKVRNEWNYFKVTEKLLREAGYEELAEKTASALPMFLAERE